MGVKLQNYIGFKCNKLTIISEPFKKRASPNSSAFIKFVKVKCDCGNTKEMPLTIIVTFRAKACGCLSKEFLTNLSKSHGLTNHPLFTTWISMKSRCYRVNSKSYKYYGLKGVKVCDEWLNDFKTFYDWCISNGWEKGLQIDRIDNDGNYEPNNCRIITAAENMRKRHTTILDVEKAKEIKYIVAHGHYTRKELMAIYKISHWHVRGFEKKKCCKNI